MWWFDQSRNFLSESRYTQTFNVFHLSSSISCGTSFEGYCWDNEGSEVTCIPCVLFCKLHFKKYLLYSASYLKDEEDSRYVNQQGVHDLFADILFADTEDFDADNDNTSSDEDAILSSSKSLEEWSEDLELEARINQQTEKPNHLQPKVFKKFLASAKSDGTQE